MLPLDRYREYLQTRGKRFTREKQLIAETVVGYRRAFQVEDLLEDLDRQRVGSRVSRSTVYRAIADMAIAGMICHFIPNDPSLWVVNQYCE